MGDDAMAIANRDVWAPEWFKLGETGFKIERVSASELDGLI
jgi:hypothetical protein